MSAAGRSIWIAAFFLVASGASALGRVEPQEKCAAAKTKASALAVSAQMQCQAKAASKGTAVDAQCLEKAESKLRARFEKAESKDECLGDADSALAAASGCATEFGDAHDDHVHQILLQPCTTGPCIDSIFGPTANARYWSRTADVNRSVDAWFVDFSVGGYGNLLKREPLYVRAVR